MRISKRGAAVSPGSLGRRPCSAVGPGPSHEHKAQRQQDEARGPDVLTGRWTPARRPRAFLGPVTQGPPGTRGRPRPRPRPSPGLRAGSSETAVWDATLASPLPGPPLAPGPEQRQAQPALPSGGHGLTSRQPGPQTPSGRTAQATPFARPAASRPRRGHPPPPPGRPLRSRWGGAAAHAAPPSWALPGSPCA